MGQVFGRNGVAEPAYEVLYRRTPDFAYEIRRYGTRFAARTAYNATGGGGGGDDQPFLALARYIGVFGTPENEGRTAISMTAPVIKEDAAAASSNRPVQIAMTAPVVISKNDNDAAADSSSLEKTMEFILPAEYDSIDKIPVPTNPRVTIRELPPSVGAVHRFAGTVSDDKSRAVARRLGQQLQEDGVGGGAVDADYALSHYQFWGYNPPFTLPMFRRNEVWVALDPAAVERLIAASDGGSEAVPKN